MTILSCAAETVIQHRDDSGRRLLGTKSDLIPESLSLLRCRGVENL
jgi:hypothetical protein